MTETTTLTDFLLARIAEDEEEARWGRLHDDPDDPDSATKILRWDHSRLAVECEAKRRIVQLHKLIAWDAGTLLLLALPYAEHPDYREEWRA